MFSSKKVVSLFLLSGKGREGFAIVFKCYNEVGTIYFSSKVSFALFLQTIVQSEVLCHRVGTDGWINHVCSILNISLL